MSSNLVGGIFLAKDQLLADISRCFQDDLYTDMTLIMSDGVSIKTSKFLLSCRCPFFATMFFGSMIESKGKEIKLNCCDSTTMNIILTYLYKGFVKLSSLSIESLLDVLETSRLLCLDLLVEGVQLHLQTMFYDGTCSIGDVLLVYDWCVGNKFEEFSYEVLEEISLRMILDNPLFSELSSEALIKIILSRKYSTAEVDLFACVSWWLDHQTELPHQIKENVLSCITLENIESGYLDTEVRSSGLFSNSNISDVLEKQITNTKHKPHPGE